MVCSVMLMVVHKIICCLFALSCSQFDNFQKTKCIAPENLAKTEII